MFVTTASSAPDLARTFSLVIAGLCRATASHIVVDRGAGPWLVRVFTRLHRLAARLTSLVTQIQAGKLPQPRPARPTAGPGRQRRRHPRLPESRGWLLRQVPGTAEYASQIQALLDDPQTAAMLEAAPQAGRILRPLCRMLALPLPQNLRLRKPRSSPSAATDTLDPPAHSPPAAPPEPSLGVAGVSSGASFAAATGPPPRPD